MLIDKNYFMNLTRVLSYMDMESNEIFLCKIGDTEAWIIVSAISGTQVKHLMAAGERMELGIAFIHQQAIQGDWTQTRMRGASDGAASDDI